MSILTTSSTAAASDTASTSSASSPASSLTPSDTQPHERWCAVFGAGDYYATPSYDLATLVGDADMQAPYVIAADGGVDHALAQGITPDAVIGDFDSSSVSVQELRKRAPHARIMQLPAEKDDTDMLAAIRIGWAQGCRHFIVFGALGGRIDHTLANVQLIAYLATLGGDVFLVGDRLVTTALHNRSMQFPTYLTQQSSQSSEQLTEQQAMHSSDATNTTNTASNSTPSIKPYLSVFAHSDVAQGVSERGLAYEVHDATFYNTEVMGVSNELVEGEAARICVTNGTLLVTFPLGLLWPSIDHSDGVYGVLQPISYEQSAALAK